MTVEESISIVPSADLRNSRVADGHEKHFEGAQGQRLVLDSRVTKWPDTYRRLLSANLTRSVIDIVGLETVPIYKCEIYRENTFVQNQNEICKTGLTFSIVRFLACISFSGQYSFFAWSLIIEIAKFSSK
jgi:hypothetical protein